MAEQQLALEVLQQFRVIYGTMRQYFREIEECCGLTGTQMWVLQEVSRTPGVGVTELAERIGIHQSTCSQMVDRLVLQGFLSKNHPFKDRRRVGLGLGQTAQRAIDALPGPAEGILPEALAQIPLVSLETLNVNLRELIRHLPGKNDDFARVPLADQVTPSDKTAAR